jgi:hypothetical protein
MRRERDKGRYHYERQFNKKVSTLMNTKEAHIVSTKDAHIVSLLTVAMTQSAAAATIKSARRSRTIRRRYVRRLGVARQFK